MSRNRKVVKVPPRRDLRRADEYELDVERNEERV
jgi:hypothetical protein